jgi:hypothetical protein
VTVPPGVPQMDNWYIPNFLNDGPPKKSAS